MLQNLPKRRCVLMNPCLALNRPWRPYMLCLSFVSQFPLGPSLCSALKGVCSVSSALVSSCSVCSVVEVFCPGCYALVGSSPVCSALVGSCLVCSALVGFCLVCSALVVSGLVCSALVGSGLVCLERLEAAPWGWGYVTNPVHALHVTHHKRSLAHHMDSCTTLTVAHHLRRHFP